MKKDFVITYIYHSCFSIEFENSVFIFDYYRGEIPKFDKNKNIYFFSSHKHEDHFSLKIFNYLNEYPNIKFILSDDIKLTDKYLDKNNIPLSVRDKVVQVGADETIDVDSLHIVTLKSTDRGVAFAIDYEGKSFYHAGDLHWWHRDWETKEYIENMARDFKKEIDKLKNHKFDIAFLPLDHRLENGFHLGFHYFMTNIEADYCIPMHMWEKHEIIDRLFSIDESTPYRDKIIKVERENQVLNIV